MSTHARLLRTILLTALTMLLVPATATATSDVRPVIDGPTQAQPGATITYTLTIHNDGPDAGDPIADLSLGHPTGDPSRPFVEFVSATGCTGSAGSNSAKCAFGTVAAGAHASATITLRLTSHAPAGSASTVLVVDAMLAGPAPGDGDTSDDHLERSLYIEPGDVTITSGPSRSSSDATPTFTFTAPGSAGLECRVDGGAWATCTSPYTTPVLAEGAHSFHVRTAGRTDLGTVRDFTIDLTAPTVTSLYVEGAANGWVTTTRPDVKFVASEQGSKFECNVDERANSCSGSSQHVTTLGQGRHTLNVRAVDAAGNAGPWRSLSFTVDTIAPSVEFARHPSQLTSSAAAAFLLRADEIASFECNVDDRGWKGCRRGRAAKLVFGGLGMGAHELEVRATDRAGNTSVVRRIAWQRVESPTMRSFSGPVGTERRTFARFEFAANESGVRFFCSVDGAVARECSSPHVVDGLEDGAHAFAIVLIDREGNVRTYRRSWRVETPEPPRMSWSRGPAGVRYTTSSQFQWDTNKGGVRSLCSLDGGAFTYCDQDAQGRRVTHVEGGLSYGKHVLRVKLVDGVSRATTYWWSWHVVRRPELATSSGPSGTVHDRSVTFTFTANKQDTWFTCRRGTTGAFTRCSSGHVWSKLAPGAHAFFVRVHDTLGNEREYVWRFTVAPDQPKLYLSGTQGATFERSAEFRFSSDRPMSRWTCMLDKAIVACSSPLRIDNLPHGAHTFTVWGQDAHGNTTRAGERRWEVVPWFSQPTGATEPRFPINLAGGGASIIAAGGGNIIATGGLNFAPTGLASIIATGGGNFISVGGAIIATGGGNIIATGGGNIIATGGGNIIAAGGGNIIATGGGNIIAAGGGNIIATGGGN